MQGGRKEDRENERKEDRERERKSVGRTVCQRRVRARQQEEERREKEERQTRRSKGEAVERER